MHEASSRSSFRIQGRYPLSGTIRPQGNKNEAMPLLAACCLTDEPVTLENLPLIEDEKIMQEILVKLGVKIELKADERSETAVVQAAQKPSFQLPSDLSSKLRGTVTLAGPLLARCGKVFLPRPGGDRIADRCFVAEPALLVLPAFGSFTGGHLVPPAAERRLWIARDDAVVDVTRLAMLAARHRA